MLKKKIITENVYNSLYQNCSPPGVLYGLPKVHKSDYPARPVLSTIGTYNYKLAKFFVSILHPYTSNEFTVKDAFSFVSEITSFTGSDRLVMASFDVSSLFTNIPLNETIDLCTDLIFDESDSFDFSDCTFKCAKFKQLLCLAVKDNHFIFNWCLYDRIDGVAMGSPLGPAFANKFMSCLEKSFLGSCPDEFRPVLYRRYVDDTFCLFHKKERAESFLILSIANIRTLNLQLSSKMITQFRFLTSLSLVMIQDFPLVCTERRLTLVYILILTALPLISIKRILSVS